MQHLWMWGQEVPRLFGGIVTISVGHCNPRVISQTKAQIDRMQHVSTCSPMSRCQPGGKLAQITPER